MVDREIVTDGGSTNLILGIVLVIIVGIGVYFFATGWFDNLKGGTNSDVNVKITPDTTTVQP